MTKVFYALAVAALAWLSAAAGLMAAVGNVHRWWDFFPLMGYGTALGVMLPVVVAACAIRVLVFSWDAIKDL
jgi:hypothetical protein